MFKFPFKIKPAFKNFLGIDIGSASIRVVELSRQAQQRRLENYGDLTISSSPGQAYRTVEKDTLSLSNKEIAETIQAILKTAGIQTEVVNFSIPDFSTFFTTFELPPMTEKELPQAVKYEARNYIPLPFSEITLDWTVIDREVPSKMKTPLKILTVAIPNEIVSQYQEIALLSNLKLKTLEAEVFALARSAVKNEKKIIGLIDIGARTTTVNILEKGFLKISHSFNIGGNELAESLHRALKIDYQIAEELKKEQGLVTINTAPQNVREILLPLIDAILLETKQIFQNFYQTEGKEIERIILAGGTVLMPGLPEYFSQELKKETILANPFSDISYPPVLAEVLKEIGPGYAIAVGLALKGLE